MSAQAQGVEGGDTLLDVDVDEEAAAEVGASTDKSGLKNIDPERYGTLVHPGDAYSFDIYSQVGRAISERPEDVLGGLVPKQVIAIGQSQSAGFLTTVVNAVHPLDPVYDGFLIHSRVANPAPVDGKYLSGADTEREDDDGVQVRNRPRGADAHVRDRDRPDAARLLEGARRTTPTASAPGRSPALPTPTPT